jgi:hypothetical protein
MKFKKYKEENVNFVSELVKNGVKVTPAAIKMCDTFNLKYNESVGRYFRHLMQTFGITNNVERIEDTNNFQLAQQKEIDGNKKRFFITWCQSETDIHTKLLHHIECYAKEINAQILVIAGRYKNPTSLLSSKDIQKSEKDVENKWDVRVLPYLDAARHNIHPHLCILSDVKIQPTSSTPLSGMNSITGVESCIIGHPRVHLRSLPVLDGYSNKLLVTTGAISIENYTDTKVGKKSEFHHQYGFVIVELDGDLFHLRQVIADKEGNFYDLNYEVKNGIVSRNKKGVDAIVFGDLHLGEEDEVALKTSFEMVDKLKANKIVLHDVVNSHSISHHEKKDPFQLLEREENGSWSLKTELENVQKFFNEKIKYNFVVVRSNHDEFIDRWLMNEDWRKSNNKLLYLTFANVIANGLAPKGIIPYILDSTTRNTENLAVDESYRVNEWELGMHGHIGVHGSKSSPIQLKNLPIKTVTGHSHVPHREDGHLSVGTLTKLRLGYNKGASAWLHSNVVIYPNGKASHIHIINGKYTTLI